jgi:natural product precursor
MGIIPRCPKLVWEEKTILIKRKMKKLNLEKLKLAAEDVLQRSEMTTIYGGSGGTCGYITAGGVNFCGVSQAVALANVGPGGNWCCDSCSSTTYCGPGSGW